MAKARRGSIIPGSRKFECDAFFGHWTEISLGINIGLAGPNLEIHFPFGFLRIGWYGDWAYNFDPKDHAPYPYEEVKIKLRKLGSLTDEEILGVNGDGEFVTGEELKWQELKKHPQALWMP